MREPTPDLRRSLCLHVCIPLPLIGTIRCKADVCKDKKKVERCGTYNPFQHTHGSISFKGFGENGRFWELLAPDNEQITESLVQDELRRTSTVRARQHHCYGRLVLVQLLPQTYSNP